MGIPAVLGAGFTAEKILEFLMRKSPAIKDKIAKSLAAGFSADKIIKFFSKDRNFEKLKDEMEQAYPLENNANPIVQSENVRSKNLGSDMASGLQRKAGPILGTAASMAASYAVGRAIPRILQSGSQAPSLMSAAQTQTQQPQIPKTLEPPLSLGNVNIPQAPNIQQHQTGGIVEKLWNDLDKPTKKSFGFESDAFLKIARRMKSTGEINSKEDFERFFQLFDQKKNEGKGLPTALKEASAEYDKQKLSPKTNEITPGNQQISETEEKKSPKIEENIVATPNGFGEVKISRNGESIVEIDGKKHKVEDTKMLKPPKEAAIEAMELIKSFTPEEMRSTHHMLNSYDEEEKKAFFFFHTGDAYVVDDISPEEYEELSKEVADAKTSGETIIGKWAKGHGSRGAGYNKIVKGHRERKVVPELVKKFRKLKVGYNLLSEWQRLLNEK